MFPFLRTLHASYPWGRNNILDYKEFRDLALPLCAPILIKLPYWLTSIVQCFFSAPKTFCFVDDRRFRRGRVFVTQNCTLKCRCRKNGIPRCAPLCKTKRKVPICGPDERLAEILDLFAGGRCTCQTKTCISTLSKRTRELCRSAEQTGMNKHKSLACN